MKLYTIILFVLSFHTLSFSQSAAKKDIEPWILGLEIGTLLIDGDIDHKILPGFSTGINFSRAINNAVSYRIGVSYGQTTGKNPFPFDPSNTAYLSTYGSYNADNPWFPAYRCRIVRLSGLLTLHLTSLGTRSRNKKNSIYMMIGPGLNSHGTSLDLKDAQGQYYSDLISLTGFNTEENANTIEGRKNIIRKISEHYDGTYESPGPKENGIFRLGNETNIHPDITFGIGISRKINNRLSIALEHHTTLSDTDLLDGHIYDQNNNLSNSNDIIHNTKLQLNFILGKNPTKSPAFWNDNYIDIDSLALANSVQLDKISESLEDNDADGVINLIDQEPSSDTSCLVSTKGKYFDLNQNDIPDCEEVGLLYQTIDNLNESLSEIQQTNKQLRIYIDSVLINQPHTAGNAFSPRFPTLFFKKDSATLSLENKKKLVDLSIYLSNERIKCIQIFGHTDSSGSEEYNINLGHQRAKNTQEFLTSSLNAAYTDIQIFSHGESYPIIELPNTRADLALNRRVTIAVCKDN